MPDDIAEALDIARQLIKAGIPVFAASPCPADCPGHTDRLGNHVPHNGGPGQYHLPYQWEKTVPSETWLEKYEPGWGLAAVGGHAADFLDSDPRNGGDVSIQELYASNAWPLTFGQQSTPSGGDHWIVAPSGERKSNGFMPGLDLLAGDPSGVGRGFVWIAPTVRPSKDPERLGELVAYRWITPPDLEGLDEYGPSARDSMQAIIDRIAEHRTAPRERESVLPRPDAHDLADPFLDASMAGAGYGGDRSFTLAEARDFVRPCLIDLQQAKIGMIEETANVAAATLSHFVPGFWSVDEAMKLLETALAHTAYDPNGPSNWTAEKFRAVLDGRRPPIDSWTAERRPEPPAPPEVTVEAEPGEETLTTLERLRLKLVSLRELSERPPPQPLIHGLLNMNTEAWMIGAPGSLKSFVALDMAGHVAQGKMWQGHKVERGKVLYLAAEGEHGMVLRSKAWILRHGATEDVTVLPYPVQVKSNDGQWDALVQIAREIEPAFIIIDTQHRVSVGLEENSATDMGILVSAVGRLKRATGACVLVVHHTGRSGSDARGSSAIDGAQDTELKIVRDEPRSALTCRLKQDKQKDMAEGAEDGIRLMLTQVDLGTDEETGRPLSSLVLLDGMEAALRAEELKVHQRIDVTEFKGRPLAEWTKHVPGIPANATVQRRILQSLADHAHARGLTRADVQKIVIDRWYSEKQKPDPSSFLDGWNKVVSAPIAENIGGERWALDQSILAGLKDEHPEL